MTLDREKKFKEAEKQLRQGKPEVALAELKRLVEAAPRDVVTLNRAGDLLAATGRKVEATEYFERLIEHYSKLGFFPKAAAILKKVLKLDPGPETLGRLGDLYQRQKLGGDARSYYLQAADGFLRARRFADARGIYEKLAAADPDDPRNRVRLAEARAAEGDTGRAAEELLALGATLAASGRAEDAERTYRRAGELAPGRPEVKIGLAVCLASQGRLGDAIDLLRTALPSATDRNPIAAELAVLLQRGGRTDELAALLDGPGGRLPDEAVARVLEGFLRAGKAEEGWRILEPLLRDATGREDPKRRVALLERLSGIEGQGHVPALRRLVQGLADQGDEPGRRRALARLAHALRASGKTEEASRIEVGLGSTVAPSVPPTRAAAQTTGTAAPEEPDAGLRFPPESPAVPLTPPDEEFVTGQLTEAEVLQNYGLGHEALARLRAVTERFPGHVAAQTKLSDLLRSQGERVELRRVLVELALARRAAGDLPGGRSAAQEAVSGAAPATPIRKLLERLALLEPDPSGPRPAPAEPRPAAAPQAPPPVRKPTGAPIAPVEPAGEVEIVFDDGPGDSRLDEDDLTSIAATLGEQIPPGSAERPAPEEDEQSLADVFDAFKRQVDQEVAADDFRTHYDLGIAYKEMGLLDDALQEFVAAARSPDLYRQACSMTALVHAERGEPDLAVDWYRRALQDAPAVGSEADLCGLRYALAEALLTTGDQEAALNLFRVISQADPRYRNVVDRVQELEAKLER